MNKYGNSRQIKLCHGFSLKLKWVYHVKKYVDHLCQHGIKISLSLKTATECDIIDADATNSYFQITPPHDLFMPRLMTNVDNDKIERKDSIYLIIKFYHKRNNYREINRLGDSGTS